MIGGAKRDRADRYRIAGLPEKYSAAADDKIRTDGAQFRAGGEAADAGVEAGSDHQMIVVTEQLIGIGCLQRHARRGRMGRGSIVLSQHGITESIGELNPIQANGRRGSVAKAKQRVIGGGASLRAGRITIQRLVIEDPHMGGAIDRPARRGLDLARQIDITNAVG